MCRRPSAAGNTISGSWRRSISVHRSVPSSSIRAPVSPTSPRWNCGWFRPRVGGGLQGCPAGRPTVTPGGAAVVLEQVRRSAGRRRAGVRSSLRAIRGRGDGRADDEVPGGPRRAGGSLTPRPRRRTGGRHCLGAARESSTTADNRPSAGRLRHAASCRSATAMDRLGRHLQ